MESLTTSISETNKKVSLWKKPGGTLGIIVAIAAGGGGLILLNKILPFLISLTTNILTLSLLVGVLAGLGFLISDKKFRRTFSLAYFIIMRKITGFVIEIDPVAVVERKVQELRRKKEEISDNMGTLRGLLIDNEKVLETDKEKLEKEVAAVKYLKEQKADRDEIVVHNNQIVRLNDSIYRQTARIIQAKKWYEILTKLEKAAKLTIIDTENAVDARKRDYEMIKKQYKAFRSVMNVINGDPDDMEEFTRGMDVMNSEINAKLGAMEHVISETGSILSDISINNGLASEKADAFIEKYEKYGIEGLFGTTDTPKIEDSGFNKNNLSSLSSLHNNDDVEIVYDNNSNNSLEKKSQKYF